MWPRTLVCATAALALGGCALPPEFSRNGAFERDAALGIEPGMTREQAREMVALRDPQFHFIDSFCLSADFPNRPNRPEGPLQMAFGPITCAAEGEDVYHAVSGLLRYANIRVVFRGDAVTRVKWDAGTGYIG